MMIIIVLISFSFSLDIKSHQQFLNATNITLTFFDLLFQITLHVELMEEQKGNVSVPG